MKPKELRRLMTSLVRASGTMGVLVAGGCGGTVIDGDPSFAGSANSGGRTSMAAGAAGTSAEAGSSSAGNSSSGCGGAVGTAGSSCCGMPEPGSCTVPKEVVVTSPSWQGTIPISCLAANPPTSGDCQCLCGFATGSPFGLCSIVETTAETATVHCAPYHGAGGRRPPGLIDSDVCLDAGDYFAHASMLEAASVVAFRVLERELSELGAPRRLLRGVRRAARDEVRHARATRSLARRYGGAARPVRTTPTPRRSLLDIALDNATEGCVRETFGALAATYQADAATDLQVRATMRRIAHEEASHAALSWQIADWLAPRLRPAERQKVADAMRAATRQLHSELANQPKSAPALGVPTARASLELLRALEAQLPLSGSHLES